MLSASTFLPFCRPFCILGLAMSSGCLAYVFWGYVWYDGKREETVGLISWRDRAGWLWSKHRVVAFLAVGIVAVIALAIISWFSPPRRDSVTTASAPVQQQPAPAQTQAPTKTDTTAQATQPTAAPTPTTPPKKKAKKAANAPDDATAPITATVPPATVPPSPTVNYAPNGIAISGENVDHPTVNNYGAQPPRGSVEPERNGLYRGKGVQKHGYILCGQSDRFASISSRLRRSLQYRLIHRCKRLRVQHGDGENNQRP
jgi:hypothetical protein